MLCTALLCACATVPRKPAPPVLFANVAPSGFPETVRFLGLDRGFMLAHAGEKLSRLRAAAHGETLNILALSAGPEARSVVARSSASRAAEIVRSSRSSRESASAR
jgi:hypothetical protein